MTEQEHINEKREHGCGGAWRVDHFKTKKAAQEYANNHAIRNCPIVKTCSGWRLCWLPPTTRYS